MQQSVKSMTMIIVGSVQPCAATAQKNVAYCYPDKLLFMEKSTSSSSLDKKEKVAKATKPRSTPKKPAYKERQNEEKGTYEKSKDGYAEKNPVPATKKSGE